MGVPLVEVLNPYRAMLAVLYPRSDQLTGVVRASSLVYIACPADLRGGSGGLRDMEAAELEPRPQRAARGCERKPKSRQSSR